MFFVVSTVMRDGLLYVVMLEPALPELRYCTSGACKQCFCIMKRTSMVLKSQTLIDQSSTKTFTFSVRKTLKGIESFFKEQTQHIFFNETKVSPVVRNLKLTFRVQKDLKCNRSLRLSIAGWSLYVTSRHTHTMFCLNQVCFLKIQKRLFTKRTHETMPCCGGVMGRRRKGLCN